VKASRRKPLATGPTAPPAPKIPAQIAIRLFVALTLGENRLDFSQRFGNAPFGYTTVMEGNDDVLNSPDPERSVREPSRDPLPSDGSQGTNPTDNAPTEGDEGGAGTEDRPHSEPEDD
jgi:hypothetical protein